MTSRFITTTGALLLQIALIAAQHASSYTRELEKTCQNIAHMKVGLHGVTREQADSLADMYFQIYFGACGGPEGAQQRNHYWNVPILVGYAGARAGAIHVSRSAGAVSYPGKPTLHPRDFPRALALELRR